MEVTPPQHLLEFLVRFTHAVSRAVASAILVLECRAEEGAESLATDDPATLWATLGTDWRSGSEGLGAALASTFDPSWCRDRTRLAALEERFAHIVASAWRRESTGGKRRRPDVLALTRDIVANPSANQSVEIVRFAMMSALRARYGLTQERETVEALREAYLALIARFELQRRRELKNAAAADAFLVDVLAMEGHVRRALTPEQARAYYRSFAERPFGIDPERGRFERLPGPELFGGLPPFPSVLKRIFAQPTGISGMDEVVGSFLPAVVDQASRGGSLITLVSGPPGSGKTTLCMAIATGMAELGSQVRYLSTEEAESGLETKHVTYMGQTPAAQFAHLTGTPHALRGSFRFLVSPAEADFFELGNLLVAELEQVYVARQPHGVYPAFPWVVVIDSLSAMLYRELPRASFDQSVQQKAARRHIGQLLNRLREAGAFVILVGSPEDEAPFGLPYLVDNVLRLDFESDPTGRHPIRTFAVEKTRLQPSLRGRHILHISDRDGCSVSPSLHAVLRLMKSLPIQQPSETEAALLCVDAAPLRQLALPGVDSDPLAEGPGTDPGTAAGSQGQPALAIRRHTHVLIYGYGSSGKASLALMCALEPRVRRGGREWRRLMRLHATGPAAAGAMDRELLARTRVLVLSFLYDETYYQALVTRLFERRYGWPRARRGAAQRPEVDVLALYPGFIDSETLVARVRQRLDEGRLSGWPYSAVVLDGVHNLVLQFPLLQGDALLWPTLFRVLRAHGVDAVTTFTFFAADGSGLGEPGSFVPTESENLFFHLLVSSCHYTMVVDRQGSPTDPPQVTLASSPEPRHGTSHRFSWDAEAMRLSEVPAP